MASVVRWIAISECSLIAIGCRAPQPAPTSQADGAPEVTAAHHEFAAPAPSLAPAPRSPDVEPAPPTIPALECPRPPLLEGWVTVVYFVTEEGKIVRPRIARGAPQDGEAALTWISSCRMAPVMVDGKPVAVQRYIKLPPPER